MRVELTEVLWLNETAGFSLPELVHLSGLPEAELMELVESGAVTPLDPLAPEWMFSADAVAAARTACRLRRDFDLDTGGLSVVLSLIERVHELEARLRHLSAQLPHGIG